MCKLDYTLEAQPPPTAEKSPELGSTGLVYEIFAFLGHLPPKKSISKVVLSVGLTNFNV